MNKEKQLRVRITDSQMKELINTISVYGWTSTKSEFVRKAIKEKIDKLNSNDKRKR